MLKDLTCQLILNPRPEDLNCYTVINITGNPEL